MGQVGRYLQERAEGAPSIEEVREALAAISEPPARRVEAEREASEVREKRAT